MTDISPGTGSMFATRWVWVSLPYATYGIAIRGTRVVEAAPIARWMVGKNTRDVASWLERKGAIVRWLEEQE